MIWGYGAGSGWMGLGMGIFWLVLIAVVVFAVTRGFSGRNNAAAASERGAEKSALDILNERYARGEIDRVEYEQKKHDIQG